MNALALSCDELGALLNKATLFVNRVTLFDDGKSLFDDILTLFDDEEASFLIG